MPNPMNFLKGMMGISSPKDMVMKMMGQTNNPMINNLVNMANNGDTKGIEQFARNYMSEQGKDFDKEFANFMDSFK